MATRSAVDDAIAKQIPLSGKDDRGIDADDFTAGIDERTARVAGIE
jgi:hypothetical protein